MPKTTHMTLPSIEGGFGTMNILKDPPKGVFTRYKEKVGDTNRITEWIDGSGDRSCEAIKVFARGVNPMVGVSYQNYGTGGGQTYGGYGSGGQSFANSLPQASLPYKVNREGAFRPPIIPPQDLLPLSRLPRLPTKEQTNIGSEMTISDKLIDCKTDMKSIREDLLRYCKPSGAIFNIETPKSEGFEVLGKISEERRQAIAQTNNKRQQNILSYNIDPLKGIDRNTTYKQVNANVMSNICSKSLLEQAGGNQPLHVKDKLQFMQQTNAKGVGENPTMRPDQQKTQKKNLPSTCFSVNPSSRAVDLNDKLCSRDYNKLLPTRKKLGGFDNGGFKPKLENLQNRSCNMKMDDSVERKAFDMGKRRNQNSLFM